MKTFEKQIHRYSKEKIEWLLCDYFDTLVKRKCSPEEIKMMWAKKIGEILNMDISAKFLYEIRIAAEKSLSEKYNGLLSRSYNYLDLCENIYSRLIAVNMDKIIREWESSSKFFEISYFIEIQLEKEYQYINENVLSILDYAHAQNWKVAIVSDFYMGKDAMQMFADSKILTRIDSIYVSCDYAKRKDSGDLYEYILKDLNILPEHCLMIGDNRISDFIVPKKFRINAVLVPRRFGGIKKNYEQYLIRKLWKLSKKNQNKTYVNYAFSLYFFVAGLYTELRKDKVKKVLFCAREGELLEGLFNLYIELNNMEDIENDYFYVSRLSTYVPSLKDLDIENFNIIFRQYHDLSVKSFMLSLGFDRDIIDLICNETGIDAENVIEEFSSSREFFILINNQNFRQHYQEKRVSQKKNFEKYLGEISKECEHISIVDVGWKGTIQDNIYNIIGQGKTIKGYYLGLSDNMNIKIGNEKKGINFSVYPKETDGFDIWSYDKSFYEKILYASHPSTIGYNSSGKPVFETNLKEQTTFEYIKPYQDQLKQLFTEIAILLRKSCYQPQDLEIIFRKIHLKNVCTINRKCIEMQDILVDGHFQNFGEFNWSQRGIATQIRKIFMLNRVGIVKKILEEGFHINYMYPGIKVLQKVKLTMLIPIYSRLVYLYMSRRMRTDL